MGLLTHPSAASRATGRQVTARATQESRIVQVSQAIEKAERAAKQRSTSASAFLPEPTWRALEVACGKRSDIACIAVGGYGLAERRRMLLGEPSSVNDRRAGSLVEMLVVEPTKARSMQAHGYINHRHALGSVLGLGISRAKVGDIITMTSGDSGAVSRFCVFIAEEVAEFCVDSLTRVDKVSFTATLASQSSTSAEEVEEFVSGQLAALEPRVAFSSSRRLDAITGACFGLSRGKAMKAVQGGEVQLSWQPTTKGSASVAAGDTISFRGKGRVKVQSVEENSKGRIVVEFLPFTS